MLSLFILTFLALRASAEQPTENLFTKGSTTHFSIQQSQQSDSQSNIIALRQGEPLEEKITRGQAHAFGLVLEAGRYAEILIEQQGIDLTVSISNPDGSPLIDLNNSAGLMGRPVRPRSSSSSCATEATDDETRVGGHHSPISS